MRLARWAGQVWGEECGRGQESQTNAGVVRSRILGKPKVKRKPGMHRARVESVARAQLNRDRT